MDKLTIGFIGGGNMGAAMIGGLVKAGAQPQNITVADPYQPSLDRLKLEFNVKTTTQNSLVCASQVIVMAVKPQTLKAVATEIVSFVQKSNCLVISICAGITSAHLAKWLSANSFVPNVVRVMPNTPALVQEGASALFAPDSVSQENRTLAFEIISSISKKSYWVNSEEMMDVVTALSGSGPAYFFLMVECLQNAAIDLGLPEDVARGLAAQTCLGAGHMLISSTQDAATLRRNVTSPNGTTEAGVKSLEKNGIRDILAKAVLAAAKRSEELGVTLGNQV